MNFLKSGLLAGLAAPALAAAAFAADLPSRKNDVAPIMTVMPAVDGVNGKVEAWGGWSKGSWPWPSSSAFGGAAGSISLPLGETFGAQFDAMVSTVRGRVAAGAGGHLFWRDPSRALLGVYGSISRINAFGATRGRVAAEGELYFDNITIGGLAGVEFGTTAQPAVFVPGFLVLPNNGLNRARFFDMVDFSVYATPDWKLSVGHRYVGGRNAIALGTEALLVHMGGTALAGFAEARFGQRDYKAALVGVKFYFGQKDKSLIARHRQDDPTIHLREDGFSAGAGANPTYAPVPAPGEGKPCGGPSGIPSQNCT